MNRKQIIALSREEQYDIYVHYLLVQLSLKHNFVVRDIIDDPENYGWGEPDKVHGNLEFRYLWKDMKYHPFDDFITIQDNMCTKDYLPMWEWYWRFKDEIVIKQKDSQNR